MGIVWVILTALVGVGWAIGCVFLMNSRLTNAQKGYNNRHGETKFFSRRVAVTIMVTVIAAMWVGLAAAQAVFGEEVVFWASAVVFGASAATVVVLIIEAGRLAMKRWVWALVILAALVALVLVGYYNIPGLKEMIAGLH